MSGSDQIALLNNDMLFNLESRKFVQTQHFLHWMNLSGIFIHSATES